MAFGLSYVLQGIIIFQFIVVSPARPTEESAPRITEQPKSLMVARGDPASFNCRAEGRPEPTISWLKNGRPLVIRHAVLDSGSLFILQGFGNRQGGQDEGIYQCVARNSHGVAYSTSATLEVAFVSPTRPTDESAPRITEQPKSLMVARGEPASFNCKAEGRPEPTISWLKNGRPLVNQGEQHVVLDSGTLFFLQVLGNRQGGQDGGIYQCVARNSHGVAYSASATLEIAYLRNEFREEPVSAQLISGDSAVLECTPPRGYPTPEVTWLKEDQPITVDNNRVNIVEDGNLLLKEVRKDDEGTYKCEARNLAGRRISREAVLTVQVTCSVPALTTGLEVTGCTAEGEAAVGVTCTYSCTSGSLSGDAMVTCGSEGTFSPAVPTCDGHAITCTSCTEMTSDYPNFPLPPAEADCSTNPGEVVCEEGCMTTIITMEFTLATDTVALTMTQTQRGCRPPAEAGFDTGDICADQATVDTAAANFPDHATLFPPELGLTLENLDVSLCTCDSSDRCTPPSPATGGGTELTESSGFQIRLVNGSHPWEGRVELLYQGEWGTICSSYWGKNDGDVACRMLGYDGAYEAISPTGAYYPRRFAEGTGPILLSDFRCTGTEANLAECSHSGWGDHNCYHWSDASLICNSPDPDSVVVRLVNGSRKAEGRVEVLYEGEFGTVCDDSWNINDANVICRMLGYEGASEAPGSARFGRGSGDIVMDDVVCLGSEENIASCEHSGWGTHNCDHGEDAGVVCTGELSLPVRLVNGDSDNEGRVEIYRYGAWGTVCDDFWDISDGNVVCRMLGYQRASRIWWGTTYGPGRGKILLDNVECTGLEATLDDCVHPGWGVHDCDHYEDAGVVCA